MVAPSLSQQWRPERRVGPMSRLGREKRDAAWSKVHDVDVESLLLGEKDADVEDIEALEDACEALVPTLITVDETADPQTEIQRLVRLAQVLQLGYERARYELDEETSSFRQDRLQQSSTDASRTSIDEEEMERLYEDLRATNEELKDSYATLDQRNEEVQELRVELDRLQAEIPDTELGHAIEAAESELYEERKKKERLEKEVQELEEMLLKNRDNIEGLQAELTDERARSNDLESKVRSLDDDVIELRAQLAAEQKKVGNQSKDERDIVEQLNKANREVDRLLRENRQLDADNTDARNKNSELASEIMQMSEKVIILDEEKQNARSNEMGLSKEKESLEAIQQSMHDDIATLEAQVEEKIALLQEFEEKFSKQYYDWEEQRQLMKARIDTLSQERDKLAYDLSMVTSREMILSGEGELAIGSVKASLAKDGSQGDMRSVLLQLAEAEERVAILVEAYEDLEKSNASDIEAAIEREKRRIAQLKLEKEHQEKELKAERKRSKQVEDDLANLQKELEDAYEQMHKYEKEYGLEEAIKDIKKLKRDQRDRDERLATLLKRLHRADITIEDLYERNQEIKRIAGLPDDVDSDMDFKLRGRIERAQLRAFNSQLEKEVQELEEERRRLRSELRFRTKWQGEHAAKLGLSAAQLSLLEEYADAMRFGDQQGAPLESRTVVRLEEEVKALQDRLSKQGQPTEIDLYEMDMTRSVGQTPLTHYKIHEQLSLTATQNRRMADSIHALKTQVKRLTTVNNQVKRTVNQALEDAAGVQPKSTSSLNNDSSEASQLLQSLLDILSGAESININTTASSGAPLVTASPTITDGALEKDLMESTEVELRQQIVDLAQELARQSAIINEHDVEMQRLARGHDVITSMENVDRRTQGVLVDDHDMERSVLSKSDVPFGQAPSEIASLSEEVIRCLEELEYKNALLQSVKNDNEAYQVRMEELLDTRNLLYREHLRLRHEWNLEKSSNASHVKQLEDRVEELSCKHSSAMKIIDTFGSDDADPNDSANLAQKLKSSMMRESVLKVKELRLSRALESALSTETQLITSKREIEQGMLGIMRSLRNRLMEAEKGKIESEKRNKLLGDKVSTMIPQDHHKVLVDEHKELQRAFYSIMAEKANAATEYVEMTKDVEKMLSLEAEHSLVKAEIKKVNDVNDSLRKMQQETQLLMKESGTGNETFIALQDELMDLRVKDANAKRNVELHTRELERITMTNNEMKGRISELEAQTSSLHKQLHLSQEAERNMSRRLSDSIEKKVVEKMEKESNALQQRISIMTEELNTSRTKAEAAEMKEIELMTQKVVRQNEINELRSAVRDLEQSSDLKSVCGRLHEELITSKGRVMSARQQVENFQIYADRISDENIHLRSMLHERESELFEFRTETQNASDEMKATISRLENSLYGHMDPSQMRKWAASMQHLKEQHESLMASADSARDRANELQLELENVELKQKHWETIENLLGDTVPETYQRNVQLCEQVLQSQLLSTRLTRENSHMKDKQVFLETQIKTTEESLLSLEEEKLRAISRSENEKAENLRQVQQLKEQLKEARGNSASIRTEYLKKMNSFNKSDGFAGASSFQRSSFSVDDQDAFSRSKQDVVLEHIEQVRLLKLENADVNFKFAEASNELFEVRKFLEAVKKERDALIERLSEKAKEHLTDEHASHAEVSATTSLKKVMQLTVDRLQKKINEQEETIASFRKLLSKTRDESLSQLKKDHEEIERLSQAVYSKNSKSIQDMRKDVSVTKGIDKEDINVNSSDGTNLRSLLREREEHISVLQHKLEEAAQLAHITREQTAIDIQKREERMKEIQDKLQSFQDSTSLRVVDSERSSLRAVIVEKNKKLKDFSKTIEVLEQKLVESMKGNANRIIAQSDQKLTDQTLHKVSSLEEQVIALQTKLRIARARKRADRGGNENSESVVELDRLRSEVKRLRQECESAQHDLQKEREKCRELRKQGNTSIRKSLEEVDKKTAIRINDLERKCAVLEAQNLKLRALIENEEGPLQDALVEIDNQVTIDDGNKRLTETKEVQTVSPDGSLFSGIPGLEKWEREKKLGKKVESIRSQLSESRKELMSVKEKYERTQMNLTNVQKDRLVMQNSIKTMKGEISKLVNTRVVGSPNQLNELNSKLEVLQEECDRLRVESAKKSSDLEHLKISNQKLLKEKKEITEAQNESSGVPTDDSDNLYIKSQEKVRELEDELMRVKSEIVAIKIEKEQSSQTITNLKSRLMDWFKDDLSGDPPTPSTHSAALKSSNSNEDSSLKNLVSSLQKVIEKLRMENDALKKGVGSNLKYMEVINKNKALRKAIADKELEYEEQTKQSNRQYIQQLKDMERTISALRGQIKREEREFSRLATPEKTDISQLNQALSEKGDHIAKLMTKLSDLDEESRKLQKVCEDLRVENSGNKKKCEELTQENSDLKTELGGLDPAFFEEVEDLKYQNKIVIAKCVKYESILTEWAGELSRPNPVEAH